MAQRARCYSGVSAARCEAARVALASWLYFATIISPLMPFSLLPPCQPAFAALRLFFFFSLIRRQPRAAARLRRHYAAGHYAIGRWLSLADFRH